MKDLPDTELVRRAKAGELEAFETLTARHERQVYLLAWRMLRHEQDAQDVTQETILSALEHLDGFRQESSFATWLLRIATHAALKVLRKLNDYVDGDVAPGVCEAFEAHLAGCNPCRVVVDNIRKTITLHKPASPANCRLLFAIASISACARSGSGRTTRAMNQPELPAYSAWVQDGKRGWGRSPVTFLRLPAQRLWNEIEWL